MTPPIVVLFDGQCRLCVHCMQRLRPLGADGALEFLDVHDPAVGERFPLLDKTCISDELHAVASDGSVHRGIGAVGLIARAVGGTPGRAVAEALALPGVRTAGELINTLVSSHRHRLGGVLKGGIS